MSDFKNALLAAPAETAESQFLCRKRKLRERIIDLGAIQNSFPDYPTVSVSMVGIRSKALGEVERANAMINGINAIHSAESLSRTEEKVAAVESSLVDLKQEYYKLACMYNASSPWEEQLRVEAEEQRRVEAEAKIIFAKCNKALFEEEPLMQIFIHQADLPNHHLDKDMNMFLKAQ